MIVKLKSGCAEIQEATDGYLIIGKLYNVQAIFMGIECSYVIYEESGISVPIPFNENYFDILDCRLSRYWQYCPKIAPSEGLSGRRAMLGPKEWCDDPFFYDDLVEGRGDAFSIWKSYYDKMELEFLR